MEKVKIGGLKSRAGNVKDSMDASCYDYIDRTGHNLPFNVLAKATEGTVAIASAYAAINHELTLPRVCLAAAIGGVAFLADKATSGSKKA